MKTWHVSLKKESQISSIYILNNFCTDQHHYGQRDMFFCACTQYAALLQTTVFSNILIRSQVLEIKATAFDIQLASS